MQPVLVLVRHGESVWNVADRITGWIDVPLSPGGRAQCATLAQSLAERDLVPQACFTSQLQRAAQTAELVLTELHQPTVIQRSWRLNERHYGGLQGLTRSEVQRLLGPEHARAVRRSWTGRPPTGPGRSDAWPVLPAPEGVATESMADVATRALPLWHAGIEPAVWANQVTLVVSHGNTLRVLIREIEHLDESEAEVLEIPIGGLRVYRASAPAGRLVRVWESAACLV